jgi:prevent-host-death family protein
MKRVPAGTFKARCLAIMKTVQATGEPVIVTKRGAPLVKLVPAETATRDIFDCMADKAEIVGDIEAPIPVKWAVMKK